MEILKTLVFLICLYTSANSGLVEDHVTKRDELLKKSQKMFLGNDIVLTDNEQKVDKRVKCLKDSILDNAFTNPQSYNFTKSFFEYKNDIKDNPLYKLLRKMPKGALLHVHDTGAVDADVIMNITYWEDLYVCFTNEKGEALFHFTKVLPTSDCPTQWQLMRDARYTYGSVEKFDAKLRKLFTIEVSNPREMYPDINTVWAAFQQTFIAAAPLLTYRPAWEHYYYETLKALVKENVMFLEIRSVLPPLYDIDGNVYDEVTTAEVYKETTEKFIRNNPEFIGAKLIYAAMRRVPLEQIEKYIVIARKLKEKMPDFFAGFDLVGQEDLGHPLKDFLKPLTEVDDLTFFFHAAETSWTGFSSDENLFDAITLGTRRIGHGYALSKYPVLLEEIKKKEIAIEVNVLSNQVLGLVGDLRNHPLAVFLANNVPVVLASDDPGSWGADVLSNDFFAAFVGVAPKHSGLKLLKKLALNSLYYSTASNKDRLVHEFEIRWVKFIDSTLKEPCSCASSSS